MLHTRRRPRTLPAQPANVFKEAAFGSVKVFALKSVDDDGTVLSEDARLLQSWQDSAFDALEKGYLRSVVLSIFSGEEDPRDRELIESYVFNVKVR